MRERGERRVLQLGVSFSLTNAVSLVTLPINIEAKMCWVLSAYTFLYSKTSQKYRYMIRNANRRFR